MISGLGISLSGLNAASLRMAVSADNIANAMSTSKETGPFVPNDVIQISQETGGTLAFAQPSQKPSVTTYDPTNLAANSDGFVQMPDVDYAEEAINQLEARLSFSANLKAIENQKAMLSSLFDMFA